MSDAAAPPGADTVLLFDGVCGLCHRLVQFLLRHDRRGHLRFAPLQGPSAAAVLARHGAPAEALTTVVLVCAYGRPQERLLRRSDAVLAAIVALGGAWRWAAALRACPRPLRDGVYAVVAASRYRLFGRLPACPVPTPAQRQQFLP